MGFTENIVSKLRLDRFFSSKLILAIDLIVSLSASVCTLMFIKVMVSSSGLTGRFILSWLAINYSCYQLLC